VGKGRENFVDDVGLYPSKGDAAIPPRGCRPFPEDYTEGQQGVHVHIRVEALSESGNVGGIRRDLCPVFVRAHVDTNGTGQMGRVGEVGIGADGYSRDVRHSMFVHIGKLVKLP
jgi:hypothetical protein